MKTLVLGEVCDVITRGISPKYTENTAIGVTVLNQKCIRNNKVSFELSRLHDLSQKSVQEVKIVRVGDILVNSTGHGTLGRTALVEKTKGTVLTDSHITIIRPKPGLFDSRYFAYLIGMREADFILMATGTSGQTELPRALLHEYNIKYEESLDKQRQIVTKLDAAFDKIDQAIELTKLNLESSRDIFDNYLREAMNNPDWRREKLSDIAVYFNGLTYKPSDVSDKGTVVLRSSNVQDDKLDFKDIVRVKSAVKDKVVVLDGDILMCSRNGSKRLIGKTAEIKDLNERMTFGTFMMIVRSAYNSYLIWYFKTQLFRSQLSRGENTSINQITRYILDDVVIPIPPTEELHRISSDFSKLFNKTREVRELYIDKIHKLSTLKKSMLNEAFSESAVK